MLMHDSPIHVYIGYPDRYAYGTVPYEYGTIVYAYILHGLPYKAIGIIGQACSQKLAMVESFGSKIARGPSKQSDSLRHNISLFWPDQAVFF